MIAGYRAVVNTRRLGMPLVIFIETIVKRTNYPDFHKAVQKLARVLECHHVTGRASFLLKAAVPGVGGLELLIGHLSQFGDTSTSLILSTVVEHRQFERPAKKN